MGGRGIQYDKGATEALMQYQNYSYGAINDVLRGKVTDAVTMETVQKTVKAMEGLEKENKNVVTVYRGDGAAVSTVLFEEKGLDSLLPDGLTHEEFFDNKKLPEGYKTWNEFLQKNLIGEIFTDKGFVSTTRDPQTAKDKFLAPSSFSKYGIPGNLSINVPKGSKFIDVDDYSSMGAGENEVILPRGSRFKVNAVSMKPYQSPTMSGSRGEEFYLDIKLDLVK